MDVGNPQHLQIIAMQTCADYRIVPDLLIPKFVCIFCKLIWEFEQYEYLYFLYSNIETFAILLDEENRTTLLKSFFYIRLYVSEALLESYQISNAIKNDIMLGVQLGKFFIELGTLKTAVKFLKIAVETCKTSRDPKKIEMLIECYSYLLYAQSFSYEFKDALKTLTDAKECLNPFYKIKKTDEKHELPNYANLYSSVSFLYFMFGEYYQALQYTNLAVKELNDQLSDKVVIKVLCLSAKVYTKSMRFSEAKLLIEYANGLAYTYIDSHPYIYAETLMDYGFYLFEIKELSNACKEYLQAEYIYTDMYRDCNLYLVLAQRGYVHAKLLERKQENNNQIKTYFYNITFSLPSVCEENHAMFYITLLDIQAVSIVLELFPNRTLSSVYRRMSLEDAKELVIHSVKAHKNYFDSQWKQQSIKTVDRILLLGHISALLSQFEIAEQYYNKAEKIFNNLTYRSNSEYCMIKFYRFELMKSFTLINDLDETLKYIGVLVARLNTFGNTYSKNVYALYNEIIRLSKLKKNRVKNLEKHILSIVTRNDWYNSRISFIKFFFKFPTDTHLKTIIDMVQKMNTTNINRLMTSTAFAIPEID